MAAANAERHLKIKINFEEMTLKSLRESSWSMSDLIDWLLGSHCHFILCHPHNHTEGLGWGVLELYNVELQRLKYHNGFPSMAKLLCPIFTVDKMRYLEALPTGYINPTLRIPLSREMWRQDLSHSATMDSVIGYVLLL